MARYPKVKIHLESTNRRVDVIREGFDLAIRVRFPPLEDSDLVIRKLAESEQRLVASPVFVKEGCNAVPADLVDMPGLAWGSSHNSFEWNLLGPNGTTAEIPYQPLLITEDMVALRLAALQGIGVCQFPTMVVRDDIKAGRLVDLLPDWAPAAASSMLLFPRGVACCLQCAHFSIFWSKSMPLYPQANTGHDDPETFSNVWSTAG